jgi:hypothetical protein
MYTLILYHALHNLSPEDIMIITSIEQLDEIQSFVESDNTGLGPIYRGYVKEQHCTEEKRDLITNAIYVIARKKQISVIISKGNPRGQSNKCCTRTRD